MVPIHVRLKQALEEIRSRKTTYLPIIGEFRQQNDINEALRLVKASKNNPAVQKEIQDIENTAQKLQVSQNRFNMANHSLQTIEPEPPAVMNITQARRIQEIVQPSMQDFPNDKAKFIKSEDRVRNIWQRQRFNDEKRTKQTHSVPGYEALLGAVSDNLMKVDLKSAGALLVMIGDSSCPEGQISDLKFNCVLKKHGPAFHSRFMELYELFVDLGGVQGGFFTYPVNSEGGGGGGGGIEELKIEQLFKAAIREVQTSVRFQSDELIGAEHECKVLTEQFVLPRIWPSLLQAQNAFLMYGPPGTGKTQLVKGVANLFLDQLAGNDVSVQMYTASGATLKGKYVGQTEKNMTWTYEELQSRAVKTGKKFAISLLFLDEIEALGASRSSGGISSTVTTLLQLLQGVDNLYPNVLTIGATNLPWELDTALLRRFDKRVLVDLPSDQVRYEVIVRTMTKRLVHYSPTGKRLKQKHENGEDLTDEENLKLDEAETQYANDKEVLMQARWLINFAYLLMFATGFQQEAKTQMKTYFVERGIQTAMVNTMVDNFIKERGHMNSKEKYPEVGDKTPMLIEQALAAESKQTTLQISDSQNLLGFTLSEVVQLVNQALNSFAIEHLKTLPDSKESACKYFCDLCGIAPGSCTTCPHINKDNAKLELSIFYKESDTCREYPSDGFMRIVDGELNMKKSVIDPAEYFDMVLYELTGVYNPKVYSNEKPPEDVETTKDAAAGT